MTANRYGNGPILKDKLWFFLGLQYYRPITAPAGYPPPINEHYTAAQWNAKGPEARPGGEPVNEFGGDSSIRTEL